MTSALSSTFDRFLRFLAVGGTATIVHFAVLVALVEAFGTDPTVATTAGYLTSAGLNYALNRAFTFRSSAAHTIALPKFALMCLLGTALNAFGMWLFSSLGLHYVPSQIVTTVFVVAMNFTIASLWIFPDAATSKVHAEDHQRIGR